ncbi:MAG: hypothetical protein K6T16_00020 [Candidatus Pacearchaeota archaeon]|nr:hypothetical protein [Candidatus Pacearchaeota archaeon]
MSKVANILLGLVLMAVPIILVLAVPILNNWGLAALEFLKGAVVIGLVLVGLVFLIIGITE